MRIEVSGLQNIDSLITYYLSDVSMYIDHCNEKSGINNLLQHILQEVFQGFKLIPINIDIR
jgi:hypothetical protein